MNLKHYFNGKIKGWGIIQNRFGKVLTRFDLNITGNWDGNSGTLQETFCYYNGKIQNRVWNIMEEEEGSFTATATNIIDRAKGKVDGIFTRWEYQMEVPVNNKIYRFTFDDRMWQMHDDVLINRSSLKKFGIILAELTCFMKK